MYRQTKKSIKHLDNLRKFMDLHIFPNERHYQDCLANATNRYAAIPLVDDLKDKAKALGLWNLFIHPEQSQFSSNGGLTHLEYAPLAEQMGHVLWSPEVFNCNAPNTGNMEVLMKYGTPDQQDISKNNSLEFSAGLEIPRS